MVHAMNNAFLLKVVLVPFTCTIMNSNIKDFLK